MKICPNCKSDVIEWHSYCPECKLHIPSFGSQDRPTTTYRSKVDRSWTTWVLIAGFITGSGLLARTIDWNELGHLLQGQTMSADEVAKVNESVNQKLARRRVNRVRQTEGGDAPNIQNIVPNLPLPTPTVDIAAAQPAATPGTATERDVVMARHNTTSRTEVAPDVDIQQIEAAPTDQTGIVSINCPVPARVYINGQYSGMTPRKVNLNAGEHQVRLVADGYLEWNSKVRVRSRQQMGVLASMTRAE